MFSKIKEEDFAELFLKNGSRSTAPVNTLISILILLNKKGWTIKELMEQIDFNILTRTALGLKDLEERPFCEATFFNFQNRILKHFIETGENLLERVFDGLTLKQIKELKIKIDKVCEGEYNVECAYQRVKSEKTLSRNKASFDKAVYASCTLAKNCPTIKPISGLVYYFEPVRFFE